MTRVGASLAGGSPLLWRNGPDSPFSSAGQHEAQGAVNDSIIFNSLLQHA